MLMMLHQLFFPLYFFFFNDTATTEIYTLSLHDALPIWRRSGGETGRRARLRIWCRKACGFESRPEHCSTRRPALAGGGRSEEHTSELQSRQYLVCRLLLEKKKKIHHHHNVIMTNCIISP